ncbi:MAG: hypothetical protein JWP81_4973 [Ferruginibacter sp.]|nr:hypothetical protein [Ferruginibacter sp.]
MDKGKTRILILTGLMACFSFLLSYAQPAVKSSIDRNEILIGEQFKLKVEASFTTEPYQINWPAIPDSLGHFEVVSRGKMDSVYDNSRLTGLVQTVTLTSFDSGKWVFPSFRGNIISAKGDSAYNFFTDSVPITVSFSVSDTTGQLRDIKPILEVATFNPVWYWVGAAVLLLALVVFLIWFFRYWKKNKSSIPVRTKVSPYDEAMEELENLKAYNFSLAADIKIAHTKMAEILKRYLSRVQKENYQNKTTGDILIMLRDQFLDKDLPAKAAASLRCGDAVKFAKYLPPASETEASIQSVRELVQDIQKLITPKP